MGCFGGRMDEEKQGITTAYEVPQSKTNVFIGENGLRSGWRLLIYFVILVASVFALGALVRMLQLKVDGLNAWGLLRQELPGFAIVLGGALIMSLIEKKPAGVYGLPVGELLGKKFWLGFVIGLMEVSLLIGLIGAFGGYSFGSIALGNNEILKNGLLYLVGFTFVGLFEEFLFRGYTQYTFADGIGFWPAAVILSTLFGGAHLMNQGEGWVGAASVVMIALFFCFTLKRTGNLWYAVGFHASFDWGETFLYSVPNSGLVMEGHLSHAVYKAGPKWLTGGTVGPEGSVFCFLTILLQYLVVIWLFPAKKQVQSAEVVTVQS
jgi:uncharacterized protein